MPVTGEYTWLETEDVIHLSIPLKGTKASNVDLFVSEKYIKLNFKPYLIELALIKSIDDQSAKATSKGGILTVKVKKLDRGKWGKLTVDLKNKAAINAFKTEQIEKERENNTRFKNNLSDEKSNDSVDNYIYIYNIYATMANKDNENNSNKKDKKKHEKKNINKEIKRGKEKKKSERKEK